MCCVNVYFHEYLDIDEISEDFCGLSAPCWPNTHRRCGRSCRLLVGDNAHTSNFESPVVELHNRAFTSSISVMREQ